MTIFHDVFQMNYLKAILMRFLGEIVKQNP